MSFRLSTFFAEEAPMDAIIPRLIFQILQDEEGPNNLDSEGFILYNEEEKDEDKRHNMSQTKKVKRKEILV